jgi:hypothetical protein
MLVRVPISAYLYKSSHSQSMRVHWLEQNTATHLGRTAQHRQGRSERSKCGYVFCQQLLSCHSSRIIILWFRVRFKFENKRTYVWREQVSGHLYTLTALPRGQNPRYPMNSRLGLANVSHDGFLACASQFINHSLVNTTSIAILCNMNYWQLC